MVPKPTLLIACQHVCFRVMLFRMVPKRIYVHNHIDSCFRVMLFRMVPKPM
ncbi:TPA: hypothetical protein IUZ63_001887 [Enterococcus faecalis]|nr:hypothetical protein [Enterococcus faecalis]